MNIIEALNIDISIKHVISIVGAGGKTTLMYNLSKELNRLKTRVLLSTTAHIYTPPRDNYDDIFISNDRKILLQYVKSIRDKGITVIGHEITAENKIKGIGTSFADELHVLDMFDFILLEADGSKKKSIKAPAEWEPMVPQSTTIIIGAIGLDSLESIASEDTVHRLDNFCSICECHPGDKINEAMLTKLINHPQGLFKNAPYDAKKIVVLNKADDTRLRESGLKIKDMVEDGNIRFVIAALKNNMYWM